MDNALKGLFGGGTSTSGAADSRSAANDFIQRVTTGDQTQGYSDEEAHAAVQHVLQNASPDTMNRAIQQSVNNLSGEQRGQFAQMLQQRQAQGRTPGTPGADGGPIIQQSGGGSMSSGGGLGDILGSLMGGSGGLLGGLLGGAASGNQSSAQTGGTASSSGGLFGSVGELMSTPVGKGVMAGAAAFALHELLNR